MEDCVHLLARFGRTVTQAEWVKELNRVSNLWLKERGRDYADFEWQGGYADFSVSQSNLDQVKQYIAGQEEHHRKIGFRDELRALLRKHEIEWEEKYFWDCSRHGSINEDEVAVRLRQSSDQTLCGNAFGPAFFRSRIAALIVKLPRHRSAFAPARAFRPCQEHFTRRVADRDWMFAFRLWRNWRRHFSRFRIHAYKEHPSVSFGGEHARFGFGQKRAAHWTGGNLPSMCVGDLKVRATIA